MEMIKFNLFDNSGTYEKYSEILRDPAGVFHNPWVEMRVPDQKPAANDMDDQNSVVTATAKRKTHRQAAADEAPASASA